MPSPIEQMLRVAVLLALLTGLSNVVTAQPLPSISDNNGVDSAERDDVPRPTDRAPSPSLDEVGYAAIMDVMAPEDGAIIAATERLPVASFAEVTSLASGRTILVRMAEQRPIANGMTIDLSCGAVHQLGLTAFPAPIRVRRVNPPEQEQAALISGRTAAERLKSPPGLLSALRRKLPPTPLGRPDSGNCALSSDAIAAPVPVMPDDRPVPPRTPRKTPAEKKLIKPAKPAASEHTMTTPAARPEVTLAKGRGFAIQVAALSNAGRAKSLAKLVGGYVVTVGGISRVRKGPYTTEAAARAALSQIRARGYADARVIPNEGH